MTLDETSTSVTVTTNASVDNTAPTQPTQSADELNRVLAALHRVDPSAVGLGDFGKPGQYIERQIARWSKQYQAGAAEPIPSMDQLIEWLPQRVPEEDETRIAHGDFRIDNVIFLSVIVSRIPPAQAKRARQIGLLLALVFRIVLLSLLVWLIGLTEPVLTVKSVALSWRDIILIGGGLFLIAKATHEIHNEVEAREEGDGKTAGSAKAFALVVAQVAAIDLRGIGKRSVRRIDFWYDTKGFLKGKADVTVFGMK